MVVCRECNKTKYSDYQEIKTGRKSVVIICNDCWAKLYGKRPDNARDSKESLREHK